MGRTPGPAQSHVLPADPVCAWEGTLRPQECLGPGSGRGGSLNAKQSLKEIDGRQCLAGEARAACCPLIVVIYGLAGASETRLTAPGNLTRLVHGLQPSACSALNLRNVSLTDSDQTR